MKNVFYAESRVEKCKFCASDIEKEYVVIIEPPHMKESNVRVWKAGYRNI